MPTLSETYTRCPNWCHDGWVKLRDSQRALYSPGTCPVCTGQGQVPLSKVEELTVLFSL